MKFLSTAIKNQPFYKFIKPFILSCLLFVIPAGLYLKTVKNPFLFDDTYYLLKNYRLAFVKDLWDAFCFKVQGNRPVHDFLIAINYIIGGLNPLNYRYTSIVIHSLNVLLIFFFLKKTLSKLNEDGDSVLVAFFASLIFGIHPIITESVNIIQFRTNLLVLFFFLLSIIIFSLYMEEKYFWRKVFFCIFSLSSVVLAMSSKESGYILPIVIHLYYLLFYYKKGSKYFPPFMYLYYATFLSIPYLLLRGEYPHYKAVGFGILPMKESLLTQFAAHLRYLSLIFFPINQNIEHYFPLRSSIFDPLVFGGCVFYTLFGILVYSLIKYRKKVILFFLALFLLMLAPTSIIPLKEYFSERYLYFPLVPIATLFCITLNIAQIRFLPKKRYLTYLLFCFISIVLCVITIKRNRVYENALSLWKDSYRKSSMKSEVVNNLALAELENGQVDKAIKIFLEAIGIDDSFMAHNNLANILATKGDFKAAIFHYQETFRYEVLPLHRYMILENMGLCYEKLRLPEEAKKCYIKAMSILPDNPKAKDRLEKLMSSSTYQSK